MPILTVGEVELAIQGLGILVKLISSSIDAANATEAERKALQASLDSTLALRLARGPIPLIPIPDPPVVVPPGGAVSP
jgi:hypothetical protein